MNILVTYATRHGNTRRIAEAVAGALEARGDVRLVPIEELKTIGADIDLFVVGGPTEGHGMTRPVVEFFDRLAPEALRGIPAAAFDTRLNWPRLLSGSAAAGIAERLRQEGARPLEPEGSFLVSRKPELEPGELERASGWALALSDQLAPALAAAT
jgi:menaquinone-dependent protoporphyrinogen IX oxidase